MARTQTTYNFKTGDLFSLDSIWNIQALAGGDWWERTGDDLDAATRKTDLDLSESLRCIRDVKITVIVEVPSA